MPGKLFVEAESQLRVLPMAKGQFLQYKRFGLAIASSLFSLSLSIVAQSAMAGDDASKVLSAKSSFDDVEVERFDFGVVTDRNGATEDWKLHPVVLIPNLPGIQYAWRIKTKESHPVFVREEFSLPEPPSTWKIKGGANSSELKNGGEQCILESFQTTEDGWIGHAWTASSGDPGGRYEIKVFLNGKFAHHFIFNVADALPQENETSLP